MVFLFVSLQQVELFWAKNWGGRRGKRKKSKQAKRTTPGYLEAAGRHFPAPVTLQQHWKFHSIIMAEKGQTCISSGKGTAVMSAPNHSYSGEQHTRLLPQFLHLKQQQLPTSHQSPEKVESCVQSAFRMKAHFISLLSAMAVNLAEIWVARSFLFSQSHGSPESCAWPTSAPRACCSTIETSRSLSVYNWNVKGGSVLAGTGKGKIYDT